MAGSPKAKKEKTKSEKGKGSLKPKGKKEKEDSAAQIENLKSIIVENELWQSFIVMVIVDGQKLYDNLLEQSNNLPENFTVVTQQNILNTNEKESQAGKNIESSKTRKGSPSKESKKTRKGSASKESKKTSNAGASDKQGKQKDENLEESNSVTTCVQLKKYILELKNTDLQTHGITITNKEFKETTKDNVNREENYPDTVNRESDPIKRYIILWGFYDMNLFHECLNFNISIKAIININEKLLSVASNEVPETEIVRKKQKGKVKKRSEPQNSEEYSCFIAQLEESKKDEKFLEINKDLLFLNYVIKSSDGEKGAYTTFESNFLKILLCGLGEAWEKFSRYNKVLITQEIPDIQETLTIDDANIYTTMISMVAPECTTVPVIMHCMLEQICWWDDYILSKIDENTEEVETGGDNNILTTSISGSKTSSQSKSENNPIVSTSTHQSTGTRSSLQSETNVTDTTPILIDDKDEIRLKTFHLQIPEIDFQKVTLDMLLSSPVYRLWSNYPPPTTSKTKWYDFHLQRLKKCAENCYFGCDKLFNLYLHQSIMNVMISKPENLSMRQEDYSIEDEESDTYFLPINDITENDSIKNYIQGLICNILCRVSKKCTDTNYFSSTESSPASSETSSKEFSDRFKTKESSVRSVTKESSIRPLTNTTLSASSKWYEREQPVVSKYRPLLDEKVNYRIMKINKLKSFLLCSEFINLYEDINQHGENDHIKIYEFVENLSVSSMCQSLQESFTNFVNVYYFYFSPSDTILLWFNNSETKDLTLTRKIKGVLETPLGFRDFYKHKLGGKNKFEEIPESESMADVSVFSDAENFSETISSSQVSNSSHASHSKVDDFPPTVVTNLGSSRIEHNEFYDYFFSPDGTKVVIKKAKYFSDQLGISVSITKNNTSLHYNLQPEASNNQIDLMMKLHNDTMVNARLTWTSPISNLEQDENNEFTDRTIPNDNLLFNSDLKITLPSGLLIEVVPVDSVLGPFYIRQRYLLKGPICGKIWEETHRCYLKNGIILTFNSDNSVYILYNNGTVVKCENFQWEKIVLDEISPKLEDERGSNENEIDEKTPRMNEGVSEKGKKGGKGKGKKEKKDDNQESISTRKKKNSKKVSSSAEETVKNENIGVESEHEIYMYKITEHSVLSWDGFCTEFNRDINENQSQVHNLRVAFDRINQELYLQRSDGATSLFTPKEFSVLFRDGSKITSYVDACKELDLETDTLVTKDSTEELDSDIEMEDDRELLDSNNEKEDESKVAVNSSESTIVSLIEASFVSSSESQNDKEQLQVDDNFVYVELSHLYEHSNYASVKYINDDCRVELTLPGGIVVYLKRDRTFTIDVSSNEKIILSEKNLVFEAEMMEESRQLAVTTLNFKNLLTNPSISCHTIDSFCNVFTVDEKGKTTLMKNGNDDLSSFIPLYPKNVKRYFVFNRDLTGYEMIKNLKIDKERNVEVMKTPLVKSSPELFSLYTQTPILKNKSEEFLMNYLKEKHLPSLIKKKDLLKLEEMPDVIWFHPNISRVTEDNSEQTLEKSKESPSAISIFKCYRIKNDINLSDWFSKALNKYMSVSEDIVTKYIHHYLDETRDEKVCAEGDRHKQLIFGSKSYYLTDNLPLVALDSLTNKEDNVSINSISESTASQLTSLFDMLRQIKQNS